MKYNIPQCLKENICITFEYGWWHILFHNYWLEWNNNFAGISKYFFRNYANEVRKSLHNDDMTKNNKKNYNNDENYVAFVKNTSLIQISQT